MCVCRNAERTGTAGDRSMSNMTGGADREIGRAGADAGGRYDENEGADLKTRGAG